MLRDRVVRPFTAFLLFLLILAQVDSASANQNEFSLQRCIERALKENAGVITAENNFGIAGQNVWSAWGGALPKASTWAGYGYRKSGGPVYVSEIDAFIMVPGTKSYSTGLGLEMTLFDGGYTWFNINKKGHQKTSSKNELRSKILSTSVDVKRAYYALVSAIMLRKVQADALARSNKQLEVTSSRYELGSASLSEKLKQQVNVANDSLLLLERQNDIYNTEFSLNLLMNRDVSLPITPTDDLKQIDFNLRLEECQDAAFRENPDLKRSKADLDAARADVRMAMSSWLPRVSADMNWSWFTLDSDRWFKYDKHNRDYTFGVTIGYSLFDAFSRKTNRSRSKLARRTYEELHDAERNSLAQKVRKAYLDIQKSKLQYETAMLLEKSAEEDMKLQNEKFRLGASSILELLDAQYSLTNAKYSKVQALFGLNMAVATMAQAMGRL